MIKKTVILFCIGVVALAWGANIASAQPGGYLRTKHTVQLSATESSWIDIEFGARNQPLTDVAISCLVTPNVEDAMRPDIVEADKGPFSTATISYGRGVLFGEYRQPSTLDIPEKESYHVSFSVRALNVPDGYRGEIGSIECTLTADVFTTEVDRANIVIRVK